MLNYKFRAKHKETKDWYYGCHDELTEYDNHISLSMFWYQVEKGWLLKETVGMYAGVNDINNKEIYAGDKFNWLGMEHVITMDNRHGYRFMYGKDILSIAYTETGIVTGNIYDSED